MTININIPSASNIATVLLETEGKTTSKKVQLNELVESFKNLGATDKDTGYISNNLLRERVKNTCSRAFYWKEIVTNFQYTRGDVPVKRNKYDISLQEIEGRNTLVIPNFKFTNVLGFISNSNTEVFNPSCYQILSVMPDMFGRVNDECKTVRFFPNQWDTNICWPNTFNKDILQNRDIAIQSTFVTHYLNSKFNRDLFEPKINPSDVRDYESDFTVFTKEVTDLTSSQLHDRDYVGWFYLLYYFLVTIKNIEPAALAGRGTCKLKTYFSRYD